MPLPTLPEDFYTHIGARLRRARKEAGLSQQTIATRLGISFQQVQKYERGINRIPLHHLLICLKEYGTCISVFLEEPDRQATVVRTPASGLLRKWADLTPYSQLAVDMLITEITRQHCSHK